MSVRYALRRKIEEDHGTSDYINDVFLRPAERNFLSAGRMVRVQYRCQDGNACETEVWRRPQRSTGTIKISRRARGHCRGYLYDDRTFREVGFHSTYELHCALVFLAHPRVLDIEDQPPAVPYIGRDGRVHHHTYDYRVTFDNGLVTAVDVKPSRDVENSDIQFIMRRALPNLEGFAHRDLLVTEKSASRSRAWNARCVIDARRDRNDDDCAKLNEIITNLHGTVSAYKLARQFSSFADGLSAVWNLVYEGSLIIPHPHQKLVDSPWVRVSSQARKLAA